MAREVLVLADEQAGEIEVARDSVKRFTVPTGDHASATETDAADARIILAAALAADALAPTLDALAADTAEAIAPALDGIRQSILQNVQPAFGSWAQPHAFKLFKPDLLGPLKPKVFEAFTPDLLGPLKLNLFGSQPLVSPVIRMPEMFTFGPEIFGNRFEGLNLGLTEPLMPNLASLGWNTPDLAFRSPLFDTASMVGNWEAVLPRIDLGAFTRVNECASMLNNTWSLLGKDALSGLLPDMPSWNILGDLQECIRSLFGNWRTLADFGHELAETALDAAIAARQAALNGDEKTVEAFARGWLGIKRLTKEALDAVVAALLDDSWLGKAVGSVAKFIYRLYVDVYHPTHRPIGETRLLGRMVGSLNWQVVQPSGGLAERGDLLQAPEPGANEWQVSDPHAVMLLDKFSADEREVLQAKFSTSERGMTWEMAAEDCGFPVKMGETVRRKLKRESARIVAAVSR
ncbi:hypothetical protein CHR55_30330 [Rhodococcus qingshengii]|uniref:Uncharacterized protein n=1 Tax=Rhodococcus qingshengii TaxID=334542 RepID=A0A2A5J0Y9_RHOSG|nr:hypothetical protein CHR55_30330 [Rhodococcus qingshengii]